MFIKRIHLITIAGFKIGIDLSWFFIAILLSWTLAAGYFPILYPKLSSGEYWFMGIIGMLSLFICVILHELGHAVVARHYKLPTSQITLFLFGGVAELQKEPTSPKVEFLMAIAGPIVSFIIAFAMYYLTSLGKGLGWPIVVIGITGYLAFINFALGIFNLIPAFPLDGGRVFRSILWGWKHDLNWATNVATRVGSGFGFALMFLGIIAIIFGRLLGGFWLIIIGWFLHRAALSMRTQFYVGKELQGETVSKFMKTDPICVSQDITIKEFVDQFVYHSYHHLYPVTERGNLVGYISLKEVKVLPHEAWGTTAVKQVMVPSSTFQTVSPETSAAEAMNLLQHAEASVLFVVKEKELVGILTSQDLFKLISLKLELEQASRR